MSAVAEMPSILLFTDNAANKVKELIEEEGNPSLKLRVFVTGGGCSGFQYGFTFDEEVNEDDTTMEKNGVMLLIDPMSYQYLVGAEIMLARGVAVNCISLTPQALVQLIFHRDGRDAPRSPRPGAFRSLRNPHRPQYVLWTASQATRSQSLGPQPCR